MSSNPDREAWLTLALTPGIGPARFLALLKAFGTPDGAHSAPFAFLCAVPGISRACATAIKEAAQGRIGAVAQEAVEKLGARTMLFTDPEYPPGLKEIPDPPMVLFAWGRTEILLDTRPAEAHEPGPSVASLPQEGSGGEMPPETDSVPVRPCARASVRPCAAIVGTRHPTQYGVEVTTRAATACAESGIAVVSGMARGCDAIAHRSALDGGGTTIGVLGNGFGVIYPAANRMLYERVRAEGLLLTEFPPGERPHAGSFPRRNRIISGLARATLVVEAGGTSGALLTAGFAL
ncbi:MAG TPA: DNA-processing protein DprA, partial [Gemmatimonadales bacterium]|nr:DNA-processing protein DprA [Gemmatimonadales bacterium]